MNVFIIMLMIFALLWDRFLISKNKRQSITNPLCIFLLFWVLVLILDALNLFEKPEISSITYAIIAIGIFSYLIGYKIGNYISIKNTIYLKNTKKVNDAILYFISAVAIVAFFSTFRSMLSNVLAGAAIGANKTLLMTGEVSLGFSYVYVFKPIRILMTFIAANRVAELKKNKGIVVISFILMAMDFISMAGKTIVVDFAISVLILYIQNKKVGGIKIPNKKPLIIGGASIVGIVAFMNSYMVNVSRSLYFYICGGVPFMNHAIANVDTYYSSCTFGATTLYGFYRIIEQVINLLGLSFGQLTENALRYLNQLENAIHFSSDYIYNAFSTAFFDLYLDGRITGVIIGMFLFGYLSSHVYKKYVYSESEYYAIKYELIILLIIHSGAKSLFTSISYAIAYCLILLVFRIRVSFEQE